jgi:tryptophanyl-tRNA synthetase
MAPIGAEMRRLLADTAEIDRVLADGAERAQAIAAPTLAEVKKLVGFWGG